MATKSSQRREDCHERQNNLKVQTSLDIGSAKGEKAYANGSLLYYPSTHVDLDCKVQKARGVVEYGGQAAKWTIRIRGEPA